MKNSLKKKLSEKTFSQKKFYEKEILTKNVSGNFLKFGNFAKFLSLDIF